MTKKCPSRQQILANAARERNSMRKRLKRQNFDDAEITNELISARLAQRHMDKVRELLPLSQKSNSRVASYHHKQKESGKIGSALKKVERPKIISKISNLPYKPLKKHVLWLSLSQQDVSSIHSLTRELESFAAYVCVSFLAFFTLLAITLL